jgi:uncharacterized membrane protein YjdF
LKPSPSAVHPVCLIMARIVYRVSVIRYQLSVISYWLLVIGYWLLVIGEKIKFEIQISRFEFNSNAQIYSSPPCFSAHW